MCKILSVCSVTKPTHLELDNGQAQARSTNGKILQTQKNLVETNRIILTLSLLLKCMFY